MSEEKVVKEKVVKEKVTIVKAVLAEQVEAGWKKKALAEHYGLTVADMGRALKACGLKIRGFHLPKFEIVEETATEDTVQEEKNFTNAEYPLTPAESFDAPIAEGTAPVETVAPTAEADEQGYTAAPVTGEAQASTSTWN